MEIARIHSLIENLDSLARLRLDQALEAFASVEAIKWLRHVNEAAGTSAGAWQTNHWINWIGENSAELQRLHQFKMLGGLCEISFDTSQFAYLAQVMNHYGDLLNWPAVDNLMSAKLISAVHALEGTERVIYDEIIKLI